MILLKRINIDIAFAREAAKSTAYSKLEQKELLALYDEFEAGDFTECRNRMRGWPSTWWQYVEPVVYKVLSNIAHGEVYLTTEQLKDPADKLWV